MQDRPDRLWEYSKATNGTGGLAALLSIDIDSLRAGATDLLHLLLVSWDTQEFWAFMATMMGHVEKVKIPIRSVNLPFIPRFTTMCPKRLWHSARL